MMLVCALIAKFALLAAGADFARTTSNRSKLAVRFFVFGGAPFDECAFNGFEMFQVGGLYAPNANLPPRIDLPGDEIPWFGLEGGANRLRHRRLPFGRDFRNGGHVHPLATAAI
jgi:hypothetical protein